MACFAQGGKNALITILLSMTKASLIGDSRVGTIGSRGDSCLEPDQSMKERILSFMSVSLSQFIIKKARRVGTQSPMPRRKVNFGSRAMNIRCTICLEPERWGSQS